MITMHRYIAEVEHDEGTVKLSLMARDKAAAIFVICASEGCPESAIFSIVETEDVSA